MTERLEAPPTGPTPPETDETAHGEESGSAAHDEAAEELAASSGGNRTAVAGLADTRRGRMLVSAFLVVLLASVGVAVMPKSQLRNDLAQAAGPVLGALGMDQYWGVFSPDPRMDTTEIIARVVYADGATEDRTIDASAGIMELRDYRWRKYEEQLWAAPDASKAWLPYAQWLTVEARGSGRKVAEVLIIRRTRESLPPGPGPDYGPWHDIQLGRVT